MYLVFDIGGTKMRFASSFDGENFHDVEIKETPGDFDSALDIIKKFIDKSGNKETENLLCCGIAGVTNPEKSMLVSSPNLPGWITKPLRTKLTEISGAKVFINNDAAMAALGEARFGAGKGKSIVAYITVGTGVGGARIVDGKPDVSEYGFEPGQQIINADVVIKGKMVNLEGLISGIGIQTRYGKKAEDLTDRDAWTEVEKFLSVGIVNTILHWSPDVVVLGGGIIQKGYISIENIKKNVRGLISIFPVIPEIKKGALGEEAGLKGGLYFLKSQ